MVASCLTGICHKLTDQILDNESEGGDKEISYWNHWNDLPIL